jgi:hypothetical protein
VSRPVLIGLCRELSGARFELRFNYLWAQWGLKGLLLDRTPRAGLVDGTVVNIPSAFKDAFDGREWQDVWRDFQAELEKANEAFEPPESIDTIERLSQICAELDTELNTLATWQSVGSTWVGDSTWIVSGKFPSQGYSPNRLVRTLWSIARRLAMPNTPVPPLPTGSPSDGELSVHEAIQAVDILIAWATSVSADETAAARSAGRKADETEAHFMQVAAAVGGESASQIMAIARDVKLTANDRLEKLSKLDSRYFGWDSPSLAGLLGNVTEQAVRQTDWWTITRPAAKSK